MRHCRLSMEDGLPRPSLSEARGAIEQVDLVDPCDELLPQRLERALRMYASVNATARIVSGQPMRILLAAMMPGWSAR